MGTLREDYLAAKEAGFTDSFGTYALDDVRVRQELDRLHALENRVLVLHAWIHGEVDLDTVVGGG